MCVFENTPPEEVTTITNNATGCSLTHGFSRGSEVLCGNKEGGEENTVRNASEAERRGCPAVPDDSFWLSPGRMRVAAAPRTRGAGGDAGGAVEHALGAAVLDRRLDHAGGRAALQLQERRQERGRKRR